MPSNLNQLFREGIQPVSSREAVVAVVSLQMSFGNGSSSKVRTSGRKTLVQRVAREAISLGPNDDLLSVGRLQTMMMMLVGDARASSSGCNSASSAPQL